MEKYLVTSALPYANGNIHIGHLVEYIQTDIFVRFQRMMGNDIYYFCAVDAHGTPITLNAKKQGVKPEAMVEQYMQEDIEDFKGFQVDFDCFYTTHSPENRKYSEFIYNSLSEKGHIVKRMVSQMYCEKDAMFLPDRFVRGTCPKCGAAEQYGDVCEKCNTTYTTSDLRDATCSICGSSPILKESEHYFFKLAEYQERLKKWLSDGVELKDDVKKYVMAWLKEPLREWDISRDSPYFGFKIPGEENKFFYVWLDAPIGYIATADKFSQGKDGLFDELWHNPERKIVHVIGKDIIYFHTLFWPAMLMGSGFSLPQRVQVHGMLTVNGEKMSKSRGTFINARNYLKFLDPQYLRFYYASKLSSGSDDIDLNFEDFLTRVNADLINNIANIASRSIQFVDKRLGGKTGKIPADTLDIQKEILEKVALVSSFFNAWDFGKGVAEICAIADIANRYFQASEPWATIKTDEEKTRDICTFMINCVRIVAILVRPIIPDFSDKVEKMLAAPCQSISDAVFKLEDHTIGKFEKLVSRVEKKHVQSLLDASKEDLEKKMSGTKFVPVKDEITIEDFSKVDLRVALVLDAKAVPGADKLLELKLDIGAETRSVFAGIKKNYKPESLIGKRMLFVANLKPRKMKFGVSEGMILAGSDDSSLVIAEFDGEVSPGSQVK